MLTFICQRHLRLGFISCDQVKVCFFIFYTMLLAGLAVSQLITPFMACEMEQMKLRNISDSITYEDSSMKEIQDYCTQQA